MSAQDCQITTVLKGNAHDGWHEIERRSQKLDPGGCLGPSSQHLLPPSRMLTSKGRSGDSNPGTGPPERDINTQMVSENPPILPRRAPRSSSAVTLPCHPGEASMVFTVSKG